MPIQTTTEDKLMKRIVVLNERVWEYRAPREHINQWLENFTGKVTDPATERLHALFWLSQFMYFGSREIRVLLKSLYRDLFLCPVIQEIKQNFPTATEEQLLKKIQEELDSTKFLGMGNPSESGVHLLYYFRQENNLRKIDFLDSVEMFKRNQSGVAEIANKNIKRYIFLDDICGSGETAIKYSNAVLGELLKLNPNAQVAYYSLFGTVKGLDYVRNHTHFGKNALAVYELDSSYLCLDRKSRYLKNTGYPDIDPQIAQRIAIKYGFLLNPMYAFGYKCSQMLLGFHHNTPDNTINIMWHDNVTHGGNHNWIPIFKRYPKILGGTP